MLTCALDERRWLRLLEEADAEELYAVVDANREHLRQWMPWAPSQTLDGILEFIRTSRRQLADNNGLQLAIIEDGRIVGVVGNHRIDWDNRWTSIGYWLAESAQGKGTMTLAARALVDHAFSGWKLNRVEIHAAVENARSRAIPERLGFAEEGMRRQAERVGDRWLDHVVYAMLAAEWAQRRKPSSAP